MYKAAMLEVFRRNLLPQFSGYIPNSFCFIIYLLLHRLMLYCLGNHSHEIIPKIEVGRRVVS
jgi:hypothetical protein